MRLRPPIADSRWPLLGWMSPPWATSYAARAVLAAARGITAPAKPHHNSTTYSPQLDDTKEIEIRDVRTLDDPGASGTPVRLRRRRKAGDAHRRACDDDSPAGCVHSLRGRSRTTLVTA